MSAWKLKDRKIAVLCTSFERRSEQSEWHNNFAAQFTIPCVGVSRRRTCYILYLPVNKLSGEALSIHIAMSRRWRHHQSAGWLVLAFNDQVTKMHQTRRTAPSPKTATPNAWRRLTSHPVTSRDYVESQVSSDRRASVESSIIAVCVRQWRHKHRCFSSCRPRYRPAIVGLLRKWMCSHSISRQFIKIIWVVTSRK